MGEEPMGEEPMSKAEFLDQHIKSLGLKNSQQYLSWCLQNGFPSSLRKSARKLSLEQEYFAEQVHSTSLRKHKELPFKVAIEKIRNSGMGKAFKYFTNAVYHEIEKNYNNDIRGGLYLTVLLYLDSVKSKLTTSTETVKSVSYLINHSDKWLKPYNTWKPKSKNIHKQLASFASHLLAKHKIPAFMYVAWDPPVRGLKHLPKEKSQDWFCHLGMGKNIRTAKGLPCTLSKKEAHFFLKAPPDYTIIEAVRWGQVHALGGNIRLMHALRETRLMSFFEYNEFCLQVIRFFIKHPMLDTVHISPIIDYIWNQKYQNRRVIVERGRETEQGPPQPNFSMTGRTPESLLKQVERWHRQLGKESKGRKLEWVHSRHADFTLRQGKIEKGNLKEWRIDNLVTLEELKAEGRAMKHCVASYADSCARGACSIWSLNMNGKKLISIELRKTNISQMRGKYNRIPDTKEMNVIKQWATIEGLSIPSYY